MPRSTTAYAVAYTAAGTLAATVVSVTVTGLALAWSGLPFEPVALWLSAGLPLVLGPVSMYPLIAMNRRQRRFRQELERLVGTDTLTGLPNRRAFFEFAKPVMERDHTTAPLTAMMIDLDHFKPINDTYGHDAGDAILTRVATAINDAVKGSEPETWIVARLGGEEFVVLLSGLVPTAVARLADRICNDVRALEHAETENVPTTVSVGVAFRARGMGIDRLLKIADDAAYTAKHGGRDRWNFGGDRRVARTLGRPLPEPANDRLAAS